jgi:small-conductance mechanosensitive channel
MRDLIPDWLAALPIWDPAVALRVLVLLFVGIPAALALSRWVRRWVSTSSNPQRGLIVGKLLWYTGLFTILVTVLTELGFSLAPLLGAAGVVGIALGFASQTSVSNVISGFFLMAEEPFRVGDIIRVDAHEGRVLSVDMMSVKLVTFDNRLVRIPNENIIKTSVVNATRFPIRRVDVRVGVAYKEDLPHVRSVLEQVAHDNPLCLIEPAPLIIFEGYGDSSLNYLFAVWASRENWLQLKTSIHEDIKAAFDREGIEIPFPHRTLYVGSVTDPFPVRMVDGSDMGPNPAGGGGGDLDHGTPGN